ncbi:MAG: cell surface protein SprA, partial [Chitinophagales bacterium]
EVSIEAAVDTPPADNNQIDLTYPIYDRFSDWLTTPSNAFDLQDPSNVEKNIDYDPETNQYILTETIGGQFFRNPTYMSFQEYLDYQSKNSEQQYWFDRSNAASALSQKGVIPEVNVNNRIFDRIFGGTAVDIRPQGNIDLTFGGNYQNILNPILTKSQRHQGGFDFDMNIQINVIGKIGDKLKITTNYNTGAVFNFENQVKLDYTGYEDEIIKKIEAGNVSLPLKGSLITGNQSLFGLKTQLQFGRLTVTNVISQQQSQAENITVQGGAQTQVFRITADQYDENRNFLLSQYFRQHYNEALAGIPIVNSQVTINKMEVWVTNKTGATVDVRDVIAFMDLGESTPYSTSPAVGPPTNNVLPYANNLTPALNSNNLYPTISHDPSVRSLDFALQTLTGPSYNLLPIQDFEKTYARKLAPNEYTFDSRVGFLMLNQQLNPDEVLGVAYQYTVNGQVYQVGEFAADVPPNVDTPSVLFLKMLKSTSTRTKLPIWDLMMKNVYSLGAYQVNSQDFFLDVYYLDPGGGEKRYVPADNINGTPLIQVLGLDRLNNNNDPQPDGVFDFINGITINPANGKVIFPVLEPFGSDLAKKFSSAVAAQPYVYQVLYDSTKTIAYQFPEFNRYSIKGSYKSSVSSEISLGAFNVPSGSVTVTAGGQKLTENVDFTVDYNLGRVKILNQSLLNSGVPINVAFENNELFSFQTKTLFGARFDYYINDKFTLGGTFLKLWERPYTVKLNAGDDPISNAIYGIDGSYTSESAWLTKMVNAIPLINTKEVSSVTLSGEGARLDPGHSGAIGKDGTVYIDDFEGTQTSYDLRFPFASWSLASTPQDPQGGLFPEGTRINDLSYGYNRAKLSWYNIDPYFWGTRAPDGIKGIGEEQNNFYSRPIESIEIFPQQDNSNEPFNQNENTFDIRFEPSKRGPYNFDTDSAGQQLTVDANGEIQLPNPEKRWGGIQRSIDQTDFEEANIEYIQFWVLDPFLNSATDGGDLYINLGNISEDVLKDSKFQYENGLSPTGDTTIENKSAWAYNPKVPPVTRAFDNDPNARQYQDVGFDGNRNIDEGRFFKSYLDALGNIYGFNSTLYEVAAADPSNDNYRYFDDPFYTDAQTGILDRYSRYNATEGNSPISSGNQAVSYAATNEPESEDLNRDNTITENEEYFQYKVHVSPQSLSLIGQNFVTDMVTYDVPTVDGYSPGQERWYQIKIPINEYNKKVGSIPDFKSIRFIRMYMTGFDTTVIMRFARMELIRNQWRKYLFSLEQPGEYLPGDNSGNTFFNLTSVSLEENSSKLPFNYVLPPGIQREQIVGQVSTTYQNEQSLSLEVCNLNNGDARAVYKNINLDLRQYFNLKMFVHAESEAGNDPLSNGDVTAFLRLGSDFTSNYYEYEVPLIISTEGDQSASNIWPDSNNFDISLDDLVNAKQARNFAGIPLTVPYVVQLANGKQITVVGNPDLGIVATAMIGIRNPKQGLPDDNGNPVCGEFWFDELRLTGFDESGGYAAIARADIRLADFGTVTLSGSMHTIGYGQLEQKLNERFKDDYLSYDAATVLELGKFFPKNAGIRLPMYAGISKANSTPQYDPYDHDILLKEKLNLIDDPTLRTAAKKDAQTYRSIGSLNFSNVRKVSMGKNAKSKPVIYSPENWNLTYAYTRTLIHSPIISSDITRQHHGELGYAFPGKSRYISPFEKLIPSKNKYLKIVRDFNL